jgi:Radical SAM superfamily
MIPRIRAALKRIVKPDTLVHKVAERVQHGLWRYAPRYFDWKPNLSSVDLDITTRCNLTCPNCSRSVGVAPADESLSLEQLDRFFHQSRALGWRWRSIKLVGGEPTLHPQFGEILDFLATHHQANPACEVRLVTNGHGRRVRETLSSLPSWVTVKDSDKQSNDHAFHSYNVAPIDVPKYQRADFRRGCFVTEYCGVALTKNGIYGCSPGAAVDRVFGFDVGLKSLDELSESTARQQFATLCRLCGHFKYNYGGAPVTSQQTSASWREALERYKKARPVLTTY